MVDIQSPTDKNMPGKKKPMEENIMACPLLWAAIINTTRMWADAQRDGRPAEYRWRPLQKFRNSIPLTRHKVWLTGAAVTLPI